MVRIRASVGLPIIFIEPCEGLFTISQVPPRNLGVAKLLKCCFGATQTPLAAFSDTLKALGAVKLGSRTNSVTNASKIARTRAANASFRGHGVKKIVNLDGAMSGHHVYAFHLFI
jgi:hypothetical protein